MDHVPRIELVYDQTCPNIDRARDNIARALRQVGLPAVWTEWDRNAEQTPRSLRDFGSPTVLVDGHDVGCDETGSPRAAASSCRVYFDDKGERLYGAPSVRLIVDTIQAVVAR